MCRLGHSMGRSVGFGDEWFKIRLEIVWAMSMGLEMVRFDQPCFLVKGAVEYFREHMALGDYLTQEGQSEMTWAGKGAEMLGLAGQCNLTHFENLCRGLHPVSGEKLMVRNKGASRRVCYFGQVSPPKDVSILHLVGGDQRIAGWWREAVAETLREVEAVTATRVRRAGANLDRQTGNMVTAIVTHDANRSLDPQLHTHLCIMNVTYDAAEGRWKSVQPTGFYRHQGYFREVCYNRLAARMLEAGYELEPVRRIGFTVKGVPAELRDTFSKRRKEILREATETTSQDELQNIALRTRAGKTNATAATLRARWLAECGGHLDTLRAVIASAQGSSRPVLLVTAIDAVDSAGAHVFERRSVVDGRVLLREGLVAGRGQVTLAALKQAVAVRERAGELIRSGDEVASQAGLEAEKEFTGWASAELKACGKLGTKPLTAGLGPDQIKAVTELLASPSRVVILQGDAGTGKTTCLKTIVAGIERPGGKVFGCAPSAGATEVLRNELTPFADTLQQLLVNESLQRVIRGHVIVVDEAGLVSVREMRDLCRLAARNENRLLLVGDTKQHSSVEAGDALRALQQYARVPVSRLTEIRRQRDPEYRKAVSLLARGDAFGAFNQLNRLRAVREFTPGDGLWQAAAADYVRTVRGGKSCLAISPVWSEIHRFTAAVREQLQIGGLLEPDRCSVVTVHPLKFTREERRRVRSYQAGDMLTFHQSWGAFQKHDSFLVLRREDRELVVRDDGGYEHRIDPSRTNGFTVGIARKIPVAKGDRLLIRANLPEAGVRNGDLVEVAGFSEFGQIVLNNGHQLPAWFHEFSHGYATTSHAAQGKTVDRGILLMAEAGLVAGNLKQAYVSNSRFRESQMIYTTDKQAAREAMMRPADRKLALEMPAPPPDETALAPEHEDLAPRPEAGLSAMKA
jgi:conjugative relaxase-like TrwC/TraI family protein